MRKLLAALACAAMIAIPTAANAADETEVGIGGQVGPSPCYVWLDYFYVNATVDTIYPFVHLSTGGQIGAHVVCPLLQLVD